MRLKGPAAWTLLALALRVGFVLKLGGRQYQTDELSHATAGLQLATEGVFGYNHVPKVIPPLPGVFYALWFKLCGASWLWPRLAQACLAAAFPLILSRLAERLLASKTAGKWTLRIAAVYPFYVYYSGMLMTETLYTLLSVPALLLFCLALKERSTRLAAVSGLLASLAALTRTEALVIFLALLPIALLLRLPPRAAGAFALAFLLPVLGWCARNKARSGFFGLDNHGGITFYNGTALFEEGEIDTRVAMDKFYASPLWASTRDLDETSFDRAMYKEAWAFMRAHPQLTLWQWWRKSVNFWRLYPRTDKVYAENVHSSPAAGAKRGVLVAVSLLFEPALIFGGLYGFWRRRRDWRWSAPIPLFVLGAWAAHALTVSMMRYRMPLMAYFMLYAATLLP